MSWSADYIIVFACGAVFAMAVIAAFYIYAHRDGEGTAFEQAEEDARDGGKGYVMLTAVGRRKKRIRAERLDPTQVIVTKDPLMIGGRP